VSKNKKAYVYKMNLWSANVFALVIFVAVMVVTLLINVNYLSAADSPMFLILIVLYFCLHEFLHGIGYYLGGGDRKKIKYGMCFEKGLLYCMDCEEVSKKGILISLQMPFVVIGVLTYIIGIIFNLPLLVILSAINISGAAMDIVMFLYIWRLKDVVYSESGNFDEFILISSEDLRRRKSLFFKVVDVKDYKKEDYIFDKVEKFTISKSSIVVLIIVLILTILSFVLG